jgi:hypothetical protein
MLKFIFGPVGGYGVGLHPITTIITTVAGMMTVVFLFTFFGNSAPEFLEGSRKGRSM